MIQRSPRAPHLQGSAEHAVKLVKKALGFYKSPLHPISFQHFIEKAQYLVNRRPIGASLSGVTLCPSDINPSFNKIDPEIPMNEEGILPTYLKQVEDFYQSFKDSW